MSDPTGAPLPPYLSTGDPGSFAMKTITWRKPKILEQVIEANALAGASLRRALALKKEMTEGTISDPFESAGLTKEELGSLFEEAELEAWRETIGRYRGKSWVGIPWYVAESMFYFRLLFAVGFYDPRSPFHLRDPYEPMKHRELFGEEGGIPMARRIAEDLPRMKSRAEALQLLLHACLWGNRVDLSNFDIAEKERGNVTARDSVNLLIDHTGPVADRLSSGKRLDFLMDNSGAELVCDLMLLDFLFMHTPPRSVILHLKRRPFFVSDTMGKDLAATVEALAADPVPPVAEAGRRLGALLREGRIEPREHSFWNGPRHFVDLPAELGAALSGSELVIVKGDAHYRRLLSDRKWEPWRDMEVLTRYFPAPFAVFRTMKSELVVDIPRERVEQLFQEDPEWMVNGRRGIIRVCRP